MALRKGLSLLREALEIQHHVLQATITNPQHQKLLINNLKPLVRAYVQPYTSSSSSSSAGLRTLLQGSSSSLQHGFLVRAGLSKCTGTGTNAISRVDSRSFSVARWVGDQGRVLQKQGLGFWPAIGRRNFNLSSLTDRFKSSTGKVKDSVVKKANGGNLKAGVSDVRAKELVGGSIWKPVNSAKQSVLNYRGALGLQLEAFWKRNYLVVVGAVGVFVCLLLWRTMFGIASMFVSLSEGMAKFGFLALAAAMVTVGGVWLRSRLTINPDSVYRIAMRRLNASEPVLEIMGAPLTGTDVRAYVMSGGGLRVKNFKPRLSRKRCFIIFPVTGAERKGLVSIEVKKKNGQYDFKLLAVDIPTAGAEHRVYLVGDEAEYRVGGGLISVLRDPIVKAMAAQKEFEESDEKEEEDELQQEWEEEEARVRERIERAELEAAEQEAKQIEEAGNKILIDTDEVDHKKEPMKA